MTHIIDDVRIREIKQLKQPEDLIKQIPLTKSASQVVVASRKAASDILHGRDDRLLVVVGPCSIHDIKAAKEYAQHLVKLNKLFANELHIIMRVYFEKPRTNIGWKGLINDPNLDDSFEINQGICMARQLLADLAEAGLSAAVEFLDSIVPQYLCDLISWGAIGARTTESQVHRELSSGLSMPIGFKNGTDGNIQIAIDAITAAKNPHHFLSVTKTGKAAIVATIGNADCHMILRGSSKGTNYDEKSIIKATKALDKSHLDPRVLVDCSHGNSQKDYTRQSLVVKSVCQQVKAGSNLVFGVMLESHLKAGNQSLKSGKELEYGVSITDACVDIVETEALLKQLAEAVKVRRERSNDGDALAQFRNKIDSLDRSIEELINERAKQAEQVAKVKKSKNSHTVMYRPEREAQIIRKILEINHGPVSDEQMETIFRQIMTACLELE